MATLLKPKGFEKIVSGFTKTVAELDDLVKFNKAAIDKNSDKITKLVDEQVVLEAEAKKADAMKANLLNFLGIN